MALSAKRVIKRSVPHAIQQAFKRHYYLRLMRSGSVVPDTDSVGVEKLVRRGDHVIDIGANVGFYSHFLSRLVGPDGNVWSFEPIPENYRILDYVMKLECSNVKLFQVALSDRLGVTTMEVPRLTLLGECLYGSRIASTPTPGLRTFDVPTATLDSLTYGQTPKFIKIDVEGHELECLSGALETIKRCKPALLIESVMTSQEQLAAVVEPLGYDTTVLKDGQFVKFNESEPRPQNVFFLPN